MRLIFLLATATLLFAGSAAAQYTVSQGGQVTTGCPQEGETLTDSNADGGSYAPNEDFTFTVCPGAGNSGLFYSISENAGDYDIHESDTLFIYDGTDINAPLLGAFNSDIAETGFQVQSTFANASGCLTFHFVSDGEDQGTGWTGLISCVNPWQPYSFNIVGETGAGEIGTDSLEICEGEEISFTLSTNYPFDGANYAQNDGIHDFFWSFGDGSAPLEGMGLNNAIHTFDGQFGYQVNVRITDIEGQVVINTFFVKVSTTPSFEGVTSELNTPTCVNSLNTLIGGVSPNSNTEFGATGTEGFLFAGGISNGQFFLPDGNGTNHTDTLTIVEFNEDQLVTSADDVISICATMEHTFLGDLEMQITCPNGTSVMLFDGYGGGPGIDGENGFGGGGTYLGNPVEEPGIAGEGFQYCFQMDPEFGTFADEFATNTVPVDEGNAVMEGSYLPEDPFETLVGCPLNGPWVLTVRDNIGIDDGWIFGWSINLSGELYDDVEPYQPGIVNAFWTEHPDFIDYGLNDTLVTFQPGAPGSYDFTFNVEDNFGCAYDTIVNVYVTELPNLEIVDEGDICENNGSVIVNIDNADPMVSYIYSWSPPELFGNPNSQGTNYFPIDGNTPISVSVSVNSVSNCVSNLDGQLTFFDVPELAMDATVGNSNCPGFDAVDLNATITGGLGEYDINWAPLGISEANTTIFPTESFEGVVSVTDECMDVIEIPFEVIVTADPPIAFAESDSIKICFNDVVNLDGLISGGTGVYTIDNSNMERLIDINPADQGWTFDPVEEEGDQEEFGNFIISDNCPFNGDINFTIDVKDCTFYPDVFTPDGEGDQFNQGFALPWLDRFENDAVKLEVFDRWGLLVYEDDNYKNYAWKGEDLTDGVYYYVIKTPNNDEPVLGNITILRGE